jgi:flagellar basal-body rod modification protein FlgD
MQVQNTDTQTPAWAAEKSGMGTITNRATLLKDDFLKLLVAQLQNQDPMNPASNQEFASQLAQFSSLEQLQQMNTSLADNLNSSNQIGQFISNSVAASFIGKDVRAVGDQVHLGASGDTLIRFSQDTTSTDTIVHIYDSSGTEVRTLDLGANPAGGLDVGWDSKDSLGNRLPEGTYSFKIEAVDASGEAVKTVSFMIGSVTGVRYVDNKASLLLGEEEVPLENVFDVIERTGSQK